MCRPTPANHVFDDLRTSLEEVMETFGYSNDGAIRNNGSGSVPCCPVVRRSNGALYVLSTAPHGDDVVEGRERSKS
jgi:hypothetical protein